MKIIIIGRSGSGKDTVAKELSSRYGYKQLCSTTTRPKRFHGEDTHVFVSETEAELLTDRVAETTINGYQYFATKKQFNECDIYIVDPKGLYDVCKNTDEDLCVVYVKASRVVRKDRAINRAADKELAAKVFEARDESEDGMFSDFEKWLTNSAFIREKCPTIKKVFVWNNERNDLVAISNLARLVFGYKTLSNFRT